MSVNLLRRKLVLYALLLFVAAILVGDWAVAEPPPPSFWDFKISNTTAQDVKNIEVKLYPAKKESSFPSSYQTLDAPHVYSISALPAGCTVEIDLPSVWCIAKIEVKAKCPGDLQTSPLSIATNRGNFEPSDPDLEYAGFTCKWDDNTYMPMGLTFAMVAGQPNAKLFGLSRWGPNRESKSANSNFGP